MEIKITRFIKSIVYSVNAAIILLAAIILHNNLHKNWNLSSYFSTDIALFILGCVMTGTAIYSYKGYSKLHREHLLDSVYLGVIGLVYLIAIFIIFFAFGGIKDITFFENGSIPANINILLMSIAPILFLVRSVVLALDINNAKREKIIAFSVIGVIIIVYIIMLLTGNIFKMVRLTSVSA